MSTEENTGLNINPLSGAFGALGNKPHVNTYAHDESDKILVSLREILSQIPAGQRLLEILDQFKIPVKIIKSRDIQYTTPDEQSIYLFTAPHYKKDIDVLAVTLACGIRDIEQSIKGFTKPDPQLDPVEFASITFSRSLDIIVTMCEISDQLKEKFGYEKPLDIIEEIGHGDIYRAYKSQVDRDSMVDMLIGNVHNESE